MSRCVSCGGAGKVCRGCSGFAATRPELFGPCGAFVTCPDCGDGRKLPVEDRELLTAAFTYDRMHEIGGFVDCEEANRRFAGEFELAAKRVAAGENYSGVSG
jgi:hypothetical protein